MGSSTEGDAASEKIWRIIENKRSCMMVTRDGETMRARPMAPIVREEEGMIYFFSRAATPKEFELSDEPQACLTFADDEANTYVSLTGLVRMSDDAEEKRRLWSLPVRSQLPEGPDDESVLLLAFAPTHGEYWDGPSSKLVTAFRMVSAIAAGKSADLGANEKARL